MTWIKTKIIPKKRSQDYKKHVGQVPGTLIYTGKKTDKIFKVAVYGMINLIKRSHVFEKDACHHHGYVVIILKIGSLLVVVLF